MIDNAYFGSGTHFFGVGISGLLPCMQSTHTAYLGNTRIQIYTTVKKFKVSLFIYIYIYIYILYISTKNIKHDFHKKY